MTCRFEHDGDCCNSGAAQYMCKCKQPCHTIIPITNADRIRAMSDDELAKFLECFGLCHHCTEHQRLGDLRIYANEKCDEMCEQHCLEWLKQPAE